MQYIKVLIILVVVLQFTSSFAQEAPTQLQHSLEQESLRADDIEMKVRELTQKAGTISSELSGIEKNISRLKKKISTQEDILNGIRKNEIKARKEHFRLENEKRHISLELSGLITSIWPVHLKNVRARFNGIESWDGFDRHFNWLSFIYKATQEKLEEAQINSEKIARNFEKQRQLEAQAESHLLQVNKNKDQLLKNKYDLRKNLKLIRKKRANIEEELKEIIATIEDLKYQLQSQKTKRFALYKRSLPWPVTGKLVADFTPKSTPPIRGLVIRATKGSNVSSIFWGKIVHNDTLRGFGHVIIVYHGYDYYSLYAYLSETFVRNGQEVEKDEPLGIVGYTPKADGPGLYFELRFHQKPINPKLWLAAKR